MHLSAPRFSSACVVLTALLLAPQTIQAQTAGVPDSGSRIRVTTSPDAERMEGTLVRWSADSLILALDDADTARFGRHNITQLALSQGRHSQTGKGALIGGVVGGAAGLALGVLAASTEECSGSGSGLSFCYETGPGEVFGIALVGAAVGTGIGALVGAASHVEEWEVVAAADVTDPAGPAIRLGLRIGSP